MATGQVHKHIFEARLARAQMLQLPALTTYDIEESRDELFPARLLVTAINEPGTLGQIATVIGDLAANIDNIVIKPLSADFREMIIDVEVADLKHLNAIISHLRARPVISKVERVNG